MSILSRGFTSIKRNSFVGVTGSELYSCIHIYCFFRVAIVNIVHDIAVILVCKSFHCKLLLCCVKAEQTQADVVEVQASFLSSPRKTVLKAARQLNIKNPPSTILFMKA